MPRLAGLIAVLIVLGGGLAGCAGDDTGPGAVPGVRHNEPVIFNDERYQVSYRFDESAAAYSVAVTRPGKALGEGDAATAANVASSTVTYYACPASTRGRVSEGSARLASKAWQMQVKCV